MRVVDEGVCTCIAFSIAFSQITSADEILALCLLVKVRRSLVVSNKDGRAWIMKADLTSLNDFLLLIMGAKDTGKLRLRGFELATSILGDGDLKALAELLVLGCTCCLHID